MALELVRPPVDVLTAIAPAAVAAAAKATRSIPIVVIDLETDPLALGLAQSLARPGGNITGVFLDFPDLSGKWLQMIREVVPGLTRVALLRDPATGAAQVRAAESAARALRLQLQTIEARRAADIEGAVAAYAARAAIAARAALGRLPSIMAFPGYVEGGGLIGHGPHLRSMFGQAGRHVVRVLRGTPPREIPIERPAQFSLLINERTAQALGLTIPGSLLARADEIVQR
jgi:putative ABC transport system substrate-binding protein